jgi:hypothetical protein
MWQKLKSPNLYVNDTLRWDLWKVTGTRGLFPHNWTNPLMYLWVIKGVALL